MWQRVEPLLAFVLAMTLVSCTPEQRVLPGEPLIPVQIDLQSGFGGQQVVIEVDRLEYVRATFEAGEPLAGPVASFLVHLSPGAHQLQVTWWQAAQTPRRPVHQHEEKLSLGEAPQYYVGIGLSNDTLQVRVQDRPFLYAKPIGLGWAGDPPLVWGCDWQEPDGQPASCRASAVKVSHKALMAG